MHARNWKQNRLASEAGVDKATIYRIVTKHQEIGPKALDGIAKAFGISPWHITGDAPESLEPKLSDVVALLEAYGKAPPDLQASIRRQLGVDPPLDRAAMEAEMIQFRATPAKPQSEAGEGE